MWVKCLKGYKVVDRLLIDTPCIHCAKGEWYQIATAENVTFSVKRDGGTSYFVWGTPHFDTTTARLAPPAKIPDIKVEPAKRKLEAGMWVKAREGAFGAQYDNANPYREIVMRNAKLALQVSSNVCVPLDYSILNPLFDLDNPLTAEEAAMHTPKVFNSEEEARQMYRGVPFFSAPEPREPYKPHTDNILQQAEKLIYGDRQKAYGSVSTNFTNIAKGWAVILGSEVSAEQVGLCMAWLKIARQVNKPNIDNLIDAAGYIGCVEKVQKGL
jgi:hypothetical protein